MTLKLMSKALLALTLVAPLAQAEPKAQPLEIQGLSQEDAKISVATIEKQVTLVQSKKGVSDLRVGLVVQDNGGSTDMGPKGKLYLTTFNESEMKDAGSAHLISNVNELISVERVAPGIYKAIVRMYEFDGACAASWNGATEGKEAIMIDARDLTAQVRAMKGGEEFGYNWYQTPVAVEFECLK